MRADKNQGGNEKSLETKKTPSSHKSMIPIKEENPTCGQNLADWLLSSFITAH